MPLAAAPPGLSIKGRALRYLAQREHSRAELECKLRRVLSLRAPRNDGRDEPGDEPGDKGDGDIEVAAPSLAQQIAAALDELTTKGFLSDERAAAQLLSSKASRFGVNRLRREMQLKGLDAGLIAATLAQAKDGELAHAREVWRRKFGQLPTDAKSYGKQQRFLAARGFSGELIRRILREPDSDKA